jgi:hypothetical protein
MNINVEKAPNNSKIWIYQADRKLTRQECDVILKESRQFVKGWATHGKPLKAIIEILFEVFLVLSVDESEFSASGCSIDKSLLFIKQIKDDLGINFLDRNIIAFYIDDQVFLEPIESVKSQIKAGKISKDSIIFNNLVNSRLQMESNWKIPVHRSWLKKYLPER